MILLLRWLVMSRSTMSPPHFKVPTSSGEPTKGLDDVEIPESSQSLNRDSKVERFSSFTRKIGRILGSLTEQGEKKI